MAFDEEERGSQRHYSYLFAHGVRVFGHHPKDDSPQGIFCANGQCAQCLVMADGRPVKACMTHIRPGMVIEPLDGLPVLPPAKPAQTFAPIKTISVECLIIGGGPAGLSAAIELGQRNVQTLQPLHSRLSSGCHFCQ